MTARVLSSSLIHFWHKKFKDKHIKMHHQRLFFYSHHLLAVYYTFSFRDNLTRNWPRTFSSIVGAINKENNNRIFRNMVRYLYNLLLNNNLLQNNSPFPFLKTFPRWCHERKNLALFWISRGENDNISSKNILNCTK